MINFAEPFVYVDLFSASPRREEIVGMLLCTQGQGIESLYHLVGQDTLDAGVVH